METKLFHPARVGFKTFQPSLSVVFGPSFWFGYLSELADLYLATQHDGLQKDKETAEAWVLNRIQNVIPGARMNKLLKTLIEKNDLRAYYMNNPCVAPVRLRILPTWWKDHRDPDCYFNKRWWKKDLDHSFDNSFGYGSILISNRDLDKIDVTDEGYSDFVPRKPF